MIENLIGARCCRACGTMEHEEVELDLAFPKAARHFERAVVALSYALASPGGRRGLVDFVQIG